MVLQGDDTAVETCEKAIRNILTCLDRGEEITDQKVSSICSFYLKSLGFSADEVSRSVPLSPQGPHGRTEGQKDYIQAMRSHTVTFGTGPAGTGKTYLAVGCAVEFLLARQVERIILVRPAVEAGEKLGYLPGDLQEKIRPYLLPLFDALVSFLGPKRLEIFTMKNIIEMAPLAYMRGRTLSNSFMILDEAQNTTAEQMKMFLTRIGEGSRAVITGDPSQVDLVRGERSGLDVACEILKDIEEIAFIRLTPGDIVRHPVVSTIVKAYERAARLLETNRH
ncbi:MAG: PhoH family protein [Planctomycetes bacterium]|nr:PhoH family protein [Planctomycetota bacterium]